MLRIILGEARVPKVFAIALCFCAMLARAAVIMPPYLQAVSHTGVCVMVECDTADPVSVDFGLTTAYGSSATTSFSIATLATTYVHRVWLPG